LTLINQISDKTALDLEKILDVLNQYQNETRYSFAYRTAVDQTNTMSPLQREHIYHRLVNEKQVDKSRLTAKVTEKPTHK
jgi:hypothetical protein